MSGDIRPLGKVTEVIRLKGFFIYFEKALCHFSLCCRHTADPVLKCDMALEHRG